MISSSSTNTVAGGGVDEEPFYIPATVPPSKLRRALKHGDTFAAVDSHGDIGASIGGQDGVFHGRVERLEDRTSETAN